MRTDLNDIKKTIIKTCVFCLFCFSATLGFCYLNWYLFASFFFLLGAWVVYMLISFRKDVKKHQDMVRRAANKDPRDIVDALSYSSEDCRSIFLDYLEKSSLEKLMGAIFQIRRSQGMYATPQGLSDVERYILRLLKGGL